MIGSKGTLYSPHDYGGAYRLLLKKNFTDFKPPQPTLPRSPGHHQEWIKRLQGRGAGDVHFVDYAASSRRPCCWATSPSVSANRVVWTPTNCGPSIWPRPTSISAAKYRKGWTL